MNGRQTADIDLFGNLEKDRAWLASVVPSLGLDFDPDDYADPKKPYVQWVREKFVSMPETDAWVGDRKPLWSGVALSVFHPPLGVLLGSKLAAGREKDMRDIQYMVTCNPEWEKDLDRYLPMFSKENRNAIEDNKVFARLFSGATTESHNMCPERKPAARRPK